MTSQDTAPAATAGHGGQFSLLATRRFLPLFVTQAIGAFNDNAFRFALAILVAYDLGPRLGLRADLINTLAAGLLIVPFFLFSATAGQLADKLDKGLIARRVKFIEIGVVALASFSLFTDQVWLQLLCVFLTGTQSAFFGPVKYAILPQHLKECELLGGNGLIETGTFLAVLLGTLFGGYFITGDWGRASVSAIMIVLAVGAWLASREIPPAPPPQPDLAINRNFFGETLNVLGFARERSDVFKAILGISWFWALGVIFLTQIPTYVEGTLGAGEAVANLVIVVFTVGIGAGSLLTNRILAGQVSVRFVPLAAILITISIVDLWFATGAASRNAPDGGPMGLTTFLGYFASWRVLFDLGAIAFFCGFYVVPLFALMQTRSAPERRARIIAANNIMNALLMTAATVVALALLAGGLSVRTLFLLTGLANALVAVYIMKLLPQELLASIARGLFRLLYRVEVKGLDNFQAAGTRAVIVGNHTSLLDGPLLSAFLPERCAFAINTHMAQAWWVKPAFTLYDLAPIDPSNPLALRALVDRLKQGQKVVIFPEGRITVTGALMKVYEGPGAIARMADAKLLPVRIDGAQYSFFSRMRGKLRLRYFPKITLTFLPPVTLAEDDTRKGHAQRQYLANKLYNVMTDTVFRTSPMDRTLLQALLDARATHGRRHVVVEDIRRTPQTYNRLVMGSFILGRKLAQMTPGERTVGVLLPNAAGCLLTIFGLHASGRVPALLNFSTGAVNMAAACAAAEVRTIVTSSRFIEAGNLQDDLKLLEARARVVYLEDVRDNVGTLEKLRGLLYSFAPAVALRALGHNPDPDAPAVVLFTSGSEGVPKGVVLSHRNLHSNRFQAAARIDFGPEDVVFNSLPMFHAFGLTGGTLLPILAGVRTFLYPSPLHYKVIPELCYDTNATVLFGTDTFLAGYAKNAHPYDFFNVRYVVAGAERVKPETREAWMEKFGIRILEGYGATECSPVLSVNTPMHYRSGTVGRLLDGIEYRLDPVEGIAEGGRLVVRGPNVMLGYLRADTPGVLEPPPDGWYDTGDIVSIDELGFVTILGRAKRFAKVAGEMVSLGNVEAKMLEAFPGFGHAVVAVPDKKKGEQLVAITTDASLDRRGLGEALRKAGLPEIAAPRNVIALKDLPVLGSGKTDYVSLNRIAREKFGG
jgi:acyl-[acyl-carrier-protein]-phospholipid O-acyltransferase/long-chain-fatty-acid--[acyl-carrier-protein] ligase